MEWRKRAITEINSKFIDIVTDVAWKFGCKVYIDEVPDDIVGPYVVIDIINGEVDFTNISEGETVNMAVEIQERIDEFYEDWGMRKVQ